MDTEIRPQTPKEILGGLREQLVGLRDYEMLPEIDGLSHEAELAVESFHNVQEELAEKRDRLRLLREEYEALPQRAFRANMDGDKAGEKKLRDRYSQVREELPTLTERVRELEAESNRLCPMEYQAAPQHGVEVRQHGPASRASTQKREEAEKLAADIRDLLDEFLDPLQKRDRSIKEYLRQHSEFLDRAKRGEHV